MEDNVVVAIAACNRQRRQWTGQRHDFRVGEVFGEQRLAIRRSQAKSGICQDAQQLGGRLTADDGCNRASSPGAPQPDQSATKYQSRYNDIGIEYRPHPAVPLRLAESSLWRLTCPCNSTRNVHVVDAELSQFVAHCVG